MNRQFVFYPTLCLAYFLLALFCASCGHGEDLNCLTPLPDDVEIEPPGPGVTPPFANLSGAWQGELEVC